MTVGELIWELMKCESPSWLVAKGINACTVVHVLGIIIDQVRMNLIVSHTDSVAIPTPSQRDTCIRYIVDGIVLDMDAADVTCCDGYTTPVIVGDVVELRLLNRLPAAHLTCVFGLIGKVSL